MKKFEVPQLVYDAMRAKEMKDVQGGRYYGNCRYCGRTVPGGGDDCGMCRPMCFMCGQSFDPGTTHHCTGGWDPRY